jgi:hypothetical protein
MIINKPLSVCDLLQSIVAYGDPKKPPNNNKIIFSLLIGSLILYKVKNFK